MIKVSKTLCTERFSGKEFKNSSVLNKGITLDDLNKKFIKSRNENRAKRIKSQRKY